MGRKKNTFACAMTYESVLHTHTRSGDTVGLKLIINTVETWHVPIVVMADGSAVCMMGRVFYFAVTVSVT